VRKLRRLSEGTNAVFTAGDVVVKLYLPRFARLAPAELATMRLLYGRLPVATPEALASGSIEGWPFLVMTRLGGRVLHDTWPRLDGAARERVVHQAGELLAAVHQLDANDLALEADWPTLVRERVAGCVARHREQGAPEALIEQIPDLLARAAPLYPADMRSVIVTGDLHDYHLLAEQRAGQWQLSGLYDFDDARLGHADYDLAATALFLAAGRPDLLRALFLGYGQPAPDAARARRLLAYTLLHRYRELRWVLREFVGRVPDTLEQLAEAIYRVD
jgi:hygromycin-B 7''-O-kinase